MAEEGLDGMSGHCVGEHPHLTGEPVNLQDQRTVQAVCFGLHE